MRGNGSEDRHPLDTAAPPLTGVRVIAVEQYGAGPFGSMLLADLGAEIIKVEDPAGGDVGRHVPPYAGLNDSIYFQSLNRRKKSVCLDTRDPRGRDVFRRLVRRSDVVYNNLRGDQPAQRGLDHASLRDVNPAIVCCHLSGFGRSGPRAREPGYDYLMQGYAGWMSITGEPDGPPQKSGLSLVDLSAGLAACVGVLATLRRAQLTGVGGDVDATLFDTAVSLLTYLGAWHMSRGYEPERQADSSHPSQVPSQVLPTRDGWMIVMCAKEKFYERLVEILGNPDLATDPRFSSFELRLENRDALVPILKDLSRQRTTDEWLRLLRGRVPCAPVKTVPETLSDPWLEESGMILEAVHPELGRVRTLNSPIRVSGRSVPLTLAPALGEHTDEVLRDVAGLSDPEITELHLAGIVTGTAPGVVTTAEAL